MSSAPYGLSISAARAGGLFASPLQRSDEPSARQVRQAIATAIGAHGVQGCAARVAQAYGEHPEIALTRMRWALTAVASAFRGSSGRAGPRPRTWLLNHDLHLPCRMSHRPEASAPRRTPAHRDRPGKRADDAHRRSHTSPVSPRLEFTTSDMQTEYRNPTTGAERLIGTALPLAVINRIRRQKRHPAARSEVSCRLPGPAEHEEGSAGHEEGSAGHETYFSAADSAAAKVGCRWLSTYARFSRAC